MGFFFIFLFQIFQPALNLTIPQNQIHPEMAGGHAQETR